MITVVDHVSPWLTPSSAFAIRIQFHEGAHISMNGTGTATVQPPTSSDLRRPRSAARPVMRFVSALVTPNTAMNEKIAVRAARWNS